MRWGQSAKPEPIGAPLEPAAFSLPLRMLGVAVVLVLAGVLVVWGVDLGRRIGLLNGSEAALSDAQTVKLLQDDLLKITAERDRLGTSLTAAIAAQQRGVVQIDTLEAEKAALAGELAELQRQLDAEAEKRQKSLAARKGKPPAHAKKAG